MRKDREGLPLSATRQLWIGSRIGYALNALKSLSHSLSLSLSLEMSLYRRKAIRRLLRWILAATSQPVISYRRRPCLSLALSRWFSLDLSRWFSVSLSLSRWFSVSLSRDGSPRGNRALLRWLFSEMSPSVSLIGDVSLCHYLSLSLWFSLSLLVVLLER